MPLKWYTVKASLLIWSIMNEWMISVYLSYTRLILQHSTDICMQWLGCVGATKWEREAASGSQDYEWRIVRERESRTAGWSSYNGICRSSILSTSRRYLHDCSPNACCSSDAAWISTGLHAQEPSQHWLQENAQLGHTDCSCKLIVHVCSRVQYYKKRICGLFKKMSLSSCH